jgi:hypothetical protein
VSREGGGREREMGRESEKESEKESERERETLHTKQNNINNKNIVGEEGPAGESERARERERGKSAGKRFLRGEKKNLFSPFVFFSLGRSNFTYCFVQRFRAAPFFFRVRQKQ